MAKVGYERQEMTGKQRKLNDKEVQKFNSSMKNAGEIMSKMMGLAGLTAWRKIRAESNYELQVSSIER
jgi:hypothetical protein